MAKVDHDFLVERLYDLAETPGGWQEILATSAAAFGADKAHGFLVGAAGVEAFELHGYDSSLIANAYHEHFEKEDPRILLSKANPGRVLCDADGRYDFAKTPVYNELLKQVGIRHSLYVQVPVAQDLQLAQAFMRPQSLGAFGRQEVAGFQRLLPHICRAIRMGRLLTAMHAENQDLRLALNRLPIPVAIVDGTGKVVCLSSRAEQLVARESCLLIKDKRLTAALPRHAHAIAAALLQTAQLSEPSTLLSRTKVSLPPLVALEAADGRQLNLSFMPLRPEHEIRKKAAPDARVLIVFQDPGDTPKIKPELIAQLHNLTPAESQLAAALAEGTSLAQYSSGRGCSEQTARTHLKRILDKTGTRRQADLVRVLMSSAALHLAQA